MKRETKYKDHQKIQFSVIRMSFGLRNWNYFMTHKTQSIKAFLNITIVCHWTTQDIVTHTLINWLSFMHHKMISISNTKRHSNYRKLHVQNGLQ